MALRVTDSEAFLNYAWEVGWLDERFGDDPSKDHDPNQLLENLLATGFVTVVEGRLIEEDGSTVPGVRFGGT